MILLGHAEVKNIGSHVHCMTLSPKQVKKFDILGILLSDGPKMTVVFCSLQNTEL